MTFHINLTKSFNMEKLILMIKESDSCQESDFGEYFKKIYKLYKRDRKNILPFNEVCRLPENNIKQYLLGLFYCLGFGCKANLGIGYKMFTELQKTGDITADTCIAFVHLAVCRDEYESYDETDNFIECDIEKGIDMFYESIEKGDNLAIVLFYIAWDEYTFFDYEPSIDRSVLANICAKGAAKNLPSAIKLVNKTHIMIGHTSSLGCESECKRHCIKHEAKILLKYLISSYKLLADANDKIKEQQCEIMALRTHIEFAPGGDGYISAMIDFKEHVRNLPL